MRTVTKTPRGVRPLRWLGAGLFTFACTTSLWAQASIEELDELLQKTYPHSLVQDPEIERSGFDVHPDFEVNLFASSPWVANPIAMSWDAHGRLWVINSPMYPQVLPGQKQTDFISVLEDTNGDGRADKCTVFYDKLYVPTGLAVGDGGVYVANQPDLLFLQDLDGDLRCDTERVLLSGFGTEDNHHAISAFVWGPGGWLYFQSGIFLHTQVETPHRLVRLDNGGVFQLRPRELRLELFNVGTATNPWGHAFDRWGQSFLTEGPQGGIWYLTPATVSNHPDERVPGTTAPKSCGARFIESRHFSDKYQGMMVLNAFKNKTVNLYEFSEDGAGYATKELQPLLIVSREEFFRPVDVQLGPDGALYIADFFQPIIGHMQYRFRDPRRDHRNGRIWRVTEKGRPLLPQPGVADAPPAQLAENLKSADAFVREHSRRRLAEIDPQIAADALHDFVDGLDPNDTEHAHHRLEALWAFQTIGRINTELLEEVLESPEPRARAAATRVLRYWLDHIPDAAARLSRLVDDPHPRVRMEALIALSYLPEPQTMELAARVVDHSTDRFLDYAFKHTARALEPHWLPALKDGRIDFGGNAHYIQASLAAVDAEDSVGILLSLLESGQIAPQRREQALVLVARLGNADELTAVFNVERLSRLLGSEGTDGLTDAAPLHARLLAALAQSTRERGVRPNATVEQLVQLVDSPHEAIRAEAIRLCGLWNVEPLRTRITQTARSSDGSIRLRAAALDALAELGGPDSLAVLKELGASDQQQTELRYRAVAELARLDLNVAAPLAAELLSTEPSAADERPADPAVVLEAFLSRQGGDQSLEAALDAKPPTVDMARLALQHINATGRQSPGLDNLLRTIAGTGSLTALLAQEDLQKLAAEIQSHGDPYRGEDVFRRKQLACLSCHSVAGGGADVGPDLEGIGVSSPMDYLIFALLDPNKAVREGYAAVNILDEHGRVLTGILKEKTDDAMVIVDASTRTQRRIPVESILDTKPAKSIMPQGLVDFMDRRDFVDLVRFIHELGRPGPFATRNIPLVRTWRVLDPLPADAAALSVPELLQWISSRDDLAWKPVYSKVSGLLPDGDMGGGTVAVLSCRIDVGTPGRILLRLNDASGVHLRLGGHDVPVSAETVVDVPQGRHDLTFALDRSQRHGDGLSVLLDEAPGSAARARVVNGL